MAVTQSDVDSALATYSTAIATVIAALVDLAAKERSMGASLSGAAFNAVISEIDLHPWSHPRLTTSPNTARLEDLIRARMAQL